MCLTFVSTKFATINNDWSIKFTESFHIDMSFNSVDNENVLASIKLAKFVHCGSRPESRFLLSQHNTIYRNQGFLKLSNQ